MLQKGKYSFFFNYDYTNENESWASTNKDSNMTSSNKGNSSYNFFRNQNILTKKSESKNNYIDKEIKRNLRTIKIPSSTDKISDKANKIENSKNSPKMINNYSPKSFTTFNNYNKYNTKKNSLINKTTNILNLKKANFKQNVPKFIFRNYLTFKQNKKEQKEITIKKKFKERLNKTHSIFDNKKNYFPVGIEIKNNHKNNSKQICEDEKMDFNKEKAKIVLLKNQYINNIKNTHILFHDIKNKMSSITEFQKNIFELNKKCVKYLALSKEDNLKKYKDENNKKLNEYKLKKNQIAKRPFSCNDAIGKKKKKKKILKKKIFSEEVTNRREKRGNCIREKNNNKKYDNINKKCYNSLRFFDEILKENQEKKLNFYSYLKQKINSNKFKNKYYSENNSIDIKL